MNALFQPELERLEDAAGRFIPLENYALRPLPDAYVKFGTVLLSLLKEYPNGETFDGTAFYSRRRPNLSEEAEQALKAANQLAYLGIIGNGGLVVYSQGDIIKTDDNMSADPSLGLSFVPDCLSFCVSKSLKQAKEGAALEEHKKAARRASEWYGRNFALVKYEVTVPEADELIMRKVERQ